MVDNEIKGIMDELRDVVDEIKGYRNKHGRKLKKASIIFLSIPDPTMISTSIGLLLLTIGKILENKKETGISDLLTYYGVELEELRYLLERFSRHM